MKTTFLINIIRACHHRHNELKGQDSRHTTGKSDTAPVDDSAGGRCTLLSSSGNKYTQEKASSGPPRPATPQQSEERASRERFAISASKTSNGGGLNSSYGSRSSTPQRADFTSVYGQGNRPDLSKRTTTTTTTTPSSSYSRSRHSAITVKVVEPRVPADPRAAPRPPIIIMSTTAKCRTMTPAERDEALRGRRSIRASTTQCGNHPALGGDGDGAVDAFGMHMLAAAARSMEGLIPDQPEDGALHKLAPAPGPSIPYPDGCWRSATAASPGAGRPSAGHGDTAAAASLSTVACRDHEVVAALAMMESPDANPRGPEPRAGCCLTPVRLTTTAGAPRPGSPSPLNAFAPGAPATAAPSPPLAEGRPGSAASKAPPVVPRLRLPNQPCPEEEKHEELPVKETQPESFAGTSAAATAGTVPPAWLEAASAAVQGSREGQPEPAGPAAPAAGPAAGELSVGVSVAAFDGLCGRLAALEAPFFKAPGSGGPSLLQRLAALEHRLVREGWLSGRQRV